VICFLLLPLSPFFPLVLAIVGFIVEPWFLSKTNLQTRIKEAKAKQKKKRFFDIHLLFVNK